MIVSLAVLGGRADSRFSEVSRHTEVRSSDTVKRRAHDVGVLGQPLAASVLLEQDGHLDRDEILAAADGLLDEIDDEDDGLMHAGSAIASLLRARWLCAEDEIKLPQANSKPPMHRCCHSTPALLIRDYAAERRAENARAATPSRSSSRTRTRVPRQSGSGPPLRQAARIAHPARLPVDVAVEQRRVTLAVVVHKHELLAERILEVADVAPAPLLDRRRRNPVTVGETQQLIHPPELSPPRRSPSLSTRAAVPAGPLRDPPLHWPSWAAASSPRSSPSQMSDLPLRSVAKTEQVAQTWAPAELRIGCRHRSAPELAAVRASASPMPKHELSTLRGPLLPAFQWSTLMRCIARS